MSGDRGTLSFVLHSHMPYVEGFGTWPFGEEWLWEAVACVYVPLLELGLQLRSLLHVEPVRLLAHALDEGGEALRHPGRRQLVGEHWGQRQRDAVRVVVEHAQQRQVAGGHRLPKPLLAERPGAEALHVGHVRVEDE
jgi:hypothetical protein